MKKLRLMAFILLLMFTLGACGTKQKVNEVNQEKQEEPATDNNKSNEKEGNADMAEQVVYPQLSTEVAENERLVQMNTNMGAIKIKMFPEQAPKTVENFLTHAKDGYYNGVIFHRVIQDFMIQGGDPQGTGRGGESIYGGPFEDEFSMQLFNLRGALSMANAGANTNGSQFFIVQSSRASALRQGYPQEIIDAYAEMGGTPHLDFGHTVFGHVIEGMDIVDAIANVKTLPGDKPAEDVVIESIDIIK